MIWSSARLQADRAASTIRASLVTLAKLDVGKKAKLGLVEHEDVDEVEQLRIDIAAPAPG